MKLVIVGAGSYVFTPTVLADAIVKHRLADSILALVDVDVAAAETMAGMARRMARELGVSCDVSATDDRRAALAGADFVILCASPQGARRWQMDYDLLAAAGLPEQVRECGGLGGLSYALRTITLALDLCRDMRELCPAATLLDVTNPMPRVVTAVHRYGGVRVYGFCNVAQGGPTGFPRVAQLVGRDPADLDVVTAGTNHFSWLVAVRDRKTGEDLLPLAARNLRAGTFARGPWDPEWLAQILTGWLDRFGAINVVGIDHAAEFLPPDPSVPFHAQSPFHGTPEERRQRWNALRDAATGRIDWRPIVNETPSWEHPVDVAVALHRGENLKVAILNMPNDGSLPQLPEGRIVEMPAEVKKGHVSGLGPIILPDATAAICRCVSDAHELIATGAATGSLKALADAIECDPAIPDKGKALAILPRLLAAHADLLPQFKANV